MTPLTKGSLVVGSSWYLPEFGKCLSSPVLEWTAKVGHYPFACGWAATHGERPLQKARVLVANEGIEIQWQEDGSPRSLNLPVHIV